ncbi:MAG: acetyl-CoA carboxylase carboxyltransferase subunit beta [Deferribacteres bacterium]|nr:acetyl-CoA carboxylase carboxyltransferase subunit beta [candidate division KSB1 bacterium]MCB9504249.1 acetyl-CoA carboxylase carboxyltransferase subunit beta [Deferribacteres bacterium]
MAWFKRNAQGIISQKKKDIPDLWLKCPGCNEIIYKLELERNANVCAQCGHHFRISADGYVKLLLDEGTAEEFHEEITSVDFLKFRAKKKYSDQIKAAIKTTGRKSALLSTRGKMNRRPVVLCVMDFSFIGGSMGSVVGEKISLAIDIAIKEKSPFILISASGGARMMEGAVSLMQMAKTSAKLALLAKAGLPFVSILTDPTTGGVTASYAMLGDVNIAEPGALIGFAGPRVIKQTIGEDLPDGFQRSEFLLKHGFIDAIFSRKNMKEEIGKMLNVFCKDVIDPVIGNGILDTEKKNTAEISPAVEIEEEAKN